MILKINPNEFQIEFENTTSKIGLKNTDHWCMCNIKINEEKKYNGDYITYQELNQLKSTLKDFYESKQVFKKRIAFIKNYLIFYLESKKKQEKRIYLKLVHIEDKKTNQIIEFKNKEIENLIAMIKTK